MYRNFIHQSVSRNQAKNLTLIHIDDMLFTMNVGALETFDLPETDHDVPARLVMGIETENNTQHKQETVQQSKQMLAPDKTCVHTSITQSIDNKTGGIYFLDAPGGCGTLS